MFFSNKLLITQAGFFLPLIITLFSIVNCDHAFSQTNYQSTGLHRVFLNKIDTQYEFYASRPEKRIIIQPGKMYYWYRPDTILNTIGQYDGRLLDGTYKEFFPQKNLKTKGQFLCGLKMGKWVSWYPTGQVYAVENWKNGLRQGEYIRYDEKGNIRDALYYENDLLNGMQIRFDSTKQIYDTILMKKNHVVRAKSLN